MMEKLEAIQQYTQALDIYTKENLLTSVLDSANSQIFSAGASAGEVVVPFIETSPLKNYKKDTGFQQGVLEVKKQTLKLEYDRGISFDVDSVDDFKTACILSMNGMQQFIKEQVVPEIDAVRFARYATNAGTKVNSDLSVKSAEEVAKAIDTAHLTMLQASVSKSGLYLFTSYDVLSKFRERFPRLVANADTAMNTEVFEYNGLKIVPVADALFSKDINVKDDGGFAAGSNGINFLIVDPTAVRQVIYHEALHVIDPAAHNTKDAWRFQYRLHHDAFVLEPRKVGVYAHTKTA